MIGLCVERGVSQVVEHPVGGRSDRSPCPFGRARIVDGALQVLGGSGEQHSSVGDQGAGAC